MKFEKKQVYYVVLAFVLCYDYPSLLELMVHQLSERFIRQASPF